jgi:CDP-glucose 4,6-dehydratase
MHFFLTGHTGFKGAWLTILLTEAGHRVSGLALDPEPGSLFDRAGLSELVSNDHRGDIRDSSLVGGALADSAPDIVVHLAAQPLVRRSFAEPRLTIETNVNGTFNVLEAVSCTPSVRAHLVITTDKVYRNVDRDEGYREDEPLGGDDPYSASKAMADILIQAWAHSFENPPMAIARAGNVIGGGDVGNDRLLPDLMRSFTASQPALIRYPTAVRPWQHVLDCLNGYLMLVEYLLRYRPQCEAWNFGPDSADFASVSTVSDIAARAWGSGAAVLRDEANHPREAGILTLDSTKSRGELGWTDRLSLEESINWTVEWTRNVEAGHSPLDVCLEQVKRFKSL